VIVGVNMDIRGDEGWRNSNKVSSSRTLASRRHGRRCLRMGGALPWDREMRGLGEAARFKLLQRLTSMPRVMLRSVVFVLVGTATVFPMSDALDIQLMRVPRPFNICEVTRCS